MPRTRGIGRPRRRGIGTTGGTIKQERDLQLLSVDPFRALWVDARIVLRSAYLTLGVIEVTQYSNALFRQSTGVRLAAPSARLRHR